MNISTFKPGQFGEFPALKQVGKGESRHASPAFPEEATAKTEHRREQMSVSSMLILFIDINLFSFIARRKTNVLPLFLLMWIIKA